MYNIYFLNRVLTICKKDDPVLKENDVIYLHPSANYRLTEVPVIMDTNQSFRHLVISEQGRHTAEELFRMMFSKVVHIDAGGGLVRNPDDGRYLMIRRNGVWDLPKGKAEKGEDIVTTSVREVAEECGVECEAGDFICTTNHVYHLDGKMVIKHTHWYAMTPKAIQNKDITGLKPQTEEGISECVWATKEEMMERMEESYGTIREVLRMAGIGEE